MDEVEDELKLKITQLKKKIKNIPKANLFAYTEYFERQQAENEIDLGFFLELAEEDKIVYNQVPVNAPIEDMEKLRNGFLTNGFFNLGDDGEIDTKRFFKHSNELAKFIDKFLDKYDDHPSIYYTENNNRFFRILKRLNKFEHGREANEFNIISENEGVNCHIPSENGCSLKCINNIFKEDFSMEYFDFIQSIKRRTNVLTRCRIPKFCERYKIQIGIYDPKSKRIFPRTVKQKDKCVFIHNNLYCVI